MRKNYRTIKDDIWGCNIHMPDDIGKLWSEFFYSQPETKHLKR